MNYIHATIVLILLLLSPLTGHAAWRTDGTLKVAVTDIVSRIENEKIDAATISDMLQARLVEKDVFKIVERAMLNKILEERKLRMAGLTEADASSVGAMAGADKIIIGSISRMADRYVVLVKGIDTKSGIVELAEQEMSPDVLDLPNAVQVLADRLVSKARGVSYTIKADHPWQNTVQVRAGQMITISALGAWNHGEQGYGSYGPEGCAKKDNGAVLAGAPVGALIGRIGNQAPIVISSGKTFAADSDGILQMTMNDWGYDNNTGSVKVQIDIK